MKNKEELLQDRETQRPRKQYKSPRTVAIMIDSFCLLSGSPGDNSPVDEENNTGNVPGMGWGEI